jgi:formate-dependent nitrite reductase membrane component NrfD
MEVHEWMVCYTRQTEWIDRRGIFLWIAFYAGALGGGLYLVSLFFNSLWGMFLSWLIIAGIKGGAHLLDLGRPTRFWRMVFRPGSSWLSRGIIFELAFLAAGAGQIAFSLWLPGGAAETVFKILAGISALGVAGYTGFVLNKVKGVPFWNSALLPLLFALYGVLCGLGLVVVIGLNSGAINVSAAEAGSRWLLVINALLIVTYLWSAANRDATGRESVMEQMHGSLAPVFWIGIVACGIVIPVIIAFSSYFVSHVASALLMGGVAGELIGGLSLGYCVLKAGAYKPLVTRAAVRIDDR